MRAPWPYKAFLFLVFSFAYGLFYVYPNLYPVFEPTFLPLTFIDTAIPFLPWTFLVYISDYLLVPSAIVLLKGRRDFHAFARRIFLILFFGGIVFWLFPTQIGRPEYPTWLQGSLMGWIVSSVWGLDAPTNCFPSMHVAFTAVATWSLKHKPGRLFAGFCGWSVLIFVSVLTTKQHYFFDVIGGLGLVALVVLLDGWLSRRPGFRGLFQAWESTGWWGLHLPRKPAQSRRKKAA